jgi:hypothetical protein
MEESENQYKKKKAPSEYGRRKKGNLRIYGF